MFKPIEKPAFVCILLAAFVCCQPLALFFGPTLHVAPYGEKNDISDRAGTLLPKEWGPKKRAAATLRWSAASWKQTGTVQRNRIDPFLPFGEWFFADPGTKTATSDNTYLNNLCFRC
jgi:hypothetical protein